jgi:hypothetical protein
LSFSSVSDTTQTERGEAGGGRSAARIAEVAKAKAMRRDNDIWETTAKADKPEATTPF